MKRAWVRSFLLSAFIPAGASAQPLPEIALDPAIECWYHSDFPMLTALVDPDEDIVNSRLYFRCSLYQDYYFVDLQTEGGAFTAVAPQAEETCPRVHYYVEAVTRDFTSARTAERVAEVTSHSECRRRYPAAAFYPGDNPEILLGSTVAGPELAPGFKSVGIGAFLSASGSVVAASSAGGGSSAALVAGVAAGGAAAAGVGALAAGSSDTTTSAPAIMVAPPPAPPAPPPAPTTTAPAPPPSPTQEVKACVRFDPIDAIVDVNESLRIDGRCSEGGDDLVYRYDLGDGRIKEGQAFITVVYRVPGTYRLTLTVSRASSGFTRAARQDEDTITRTVRVKQDLVADFSAHNIGIDACHAEFDASKSVGQITDYEWVLDVNNEFGEGPVRKTGRIVQHEWLSSGCFKAGGRMVAGLTVVGPDGETDSLQKQVNVFAPKPLRTVTPAIQTSLTTELMAPERTTAQVIVGERLVQPVSAGAPHLHRYPGTLGRNLVEGLLLSPLEEPVLWRFDFSQTSFVVPGSVRLVSGTEVSRDARSIVVRLSGRAGERVRIEYELER